MPRVEYRVERNYNDRQHGDRDWGRPEHGDQRDRQLRKEPSHERRDYRGERFERGNDNNRQSQVVQTTRTTTVRNPSGTTVVRKRTNVRESVRQR
jgi:hypothetical protein